MIRCDICLKSPSLLNRSYAHLWESKHGLLLLENSRLKEDQRQAHDMWPTSFCALLMECTSCEGPLFINCSPVDLQASKAYLDKLEATGPNDRASKEEAIYDRLFQGFHDHSTRRGWGDHYCQISDELWIQDKAHLAIPANFSSILISMLTMKAFFLACKIT